MTKVTLNNVGSLIDATTAASAINANFDAIETAFDNTYSRDGSAPNTANAALDMNSNQIYNLPAPSTVNSPARLIDVTSNPTIVVPGTGTSGHVVPFLDGNNTFSGTNTFNTLPTFPANSIPNAKLATMAANTIKGSIAGGTPADLTNTQVTALVNPVTSTLSGAAPASGGGTTNFLRSDSTWASTAWTLLETVTATNSAALQSTVSWAPYSQIEIVFYNLIPATSAQTMLLQVHSGGSYQSGGSYLSAYNAWVTNSSAQGTITSGIPLSQLNASTNAASGISGRIRGVNLSSTTNNKHWFGESIELNSSVLLAGIHTIGTWTGALTAVDGCQIVMTSGNITSGFIKIYGIL